MGISGLVVVAIKLWTYESVEYSLKQNEWKRASVFRLCRSWNILSSNYDNDCDDSKGRPDKKKSDIVSFIVTHVAVEKRSPEKTKRNISFLSKLTNPLKSDKFVNIHLMFGLTSARGCESYHRRWRRCYRPKKNERIRLYKISFFKICSRALDHEEKK